MINKGMRLQNELPSKQALTHDGKELDMFMVFHSSTKGTHASELLPFAVLSDVTCGESLVSLRSTQ
jgi:hypothetical protein